MELREKVTREVNKALFGPLVDAQYQDGKPVDHHYAAEVLSVLKASGATPMSTLDIVNAICRREGRPMSNEEAATYLESAAEYIREGVEGDAESLVEVVHEWLDNSCPQPDAEVAPA